MNVRCVDDQGRPVARATIEVRLNGASLDSARTDEQGRLLIAHARHPAARMIVSARGFETVEEPFAGRQPGPGEQVIVLRAGGSVRGTARWPGGQAPGSAVTVLAWPAGREPSPSSLAETDLGGPGTSLRVAPTGEGGGFLFEGLSADAEYVLAAAGLGGCTLERAGPVRPGSGPVVLTLQPIYAALVHLRDPDGRPLRCDPLLFGSLGWVMRDPRAVDVFGIRWRAELDLVGETRLHAGLANTRDDKLLLFTSEILVDALGPLEFEANIPGYAPAGGEFFAALADRSPSEFELRLESVGEAWGKLRVSVSGPPAVLAAEAEDERFLG
ncbi:MAG: hypothetical protein QGI46_06110 [Planctomycetota bacterium]|nr:hypothetical protein [Planctomycetota bacterium]